MKRSRTLGANLNQKGQCEFRVWAPYAQNLSLLLILKQGQVYQLPMRVESDNYYYLKLDNIAAGDRYYYCFNDKKFADPASDYQPEGINGPSEVVLHSSFKPWAAPALEEYIIYELHVGTFTKEGTFSAIIPYLAKLEELGINAIELMPIAQFSGARNWGYDGVFPFAVQNSYGTPESLKQLIKACHQHHISVILDVVYNHIGPEGNYFSQFGPYFTDKYQSPWGAAMNFDGQYSHQVRRYFIENAIHWLSDYGFDALRLDAIQAIIDNSAKPFLSELSDAVHALSEKLKFRFYLTAECDTNDLRPIRPVSAHGYGLDAVWSNDFHNSLHALLTDERQSFYVDFGDVDKLIKAYGEGFVYSGQYSEFRKKPYGTSSKDALSKSFIVALQNHDNIGNRVLGDRLSSILPRDKLKLAVGLLLTSPYIPMLFMGEEYGETAPFLYFIDHEGQELVRAVREGRAREFGIPLTDTYDPKALSTFIDSKLNHKLRLECQHKLLMDYYKKLIQIRKREFNLNLFDKKNIRIDKSSDQKLLIIKFNYGVKDYLILASFASHTYEIATYLDDVDWDLLISSFDFDVIPKILPAFGFILYKRKS